MYQKEYTGIRDPLGILGFDFSYSFYEGNHLYANLLKIVSILAVCSI